MSIKKLTKLKDRIKEIRETFSLNKKELAEKLGVSPAYITDIESGKKEKVSKMFTKLISCEFGINLGWLEKGEGSIFKDSNNEMLFEKKLMELSKDLPSVVKDSIVQYVDEKRQLYQLIEEKQKKIKK